MPGMSRLSLRASYWLPRSCLYCPWPSGPLGRGGPDASDSCSRWRVVPFLLAGAIAPTPTWYQYYYAVVPFMALAVLFGASALYSIGGWWRWATALFGVAALVCAAYAIPAYTKLNMSLSSAGWVPLKTHAVGEEIRRAVGMGRVLTLAPLFPLEGGLDIYDELAAGAVRSAHGQFADLRAKDGR